MYPYNDIPLQYHSFIALKLLCALPIPLPLPTKPQKPLIFIIFSRVLPFPGYIAGIIWYVAFPDWLLSASFT